MNEPSQLPPRPPRLVGSPTPPNPPLPPVEPPREPPAASYTPFYPSLQEEPQKRSQSLPLLILIILLIAAIGFSLFRTQIVTYYQTFLGIQSETSTSENSPTKPIIEATAPAPTSGVRVEIQPGVKEESLLQAAGAPSTLTVTYSNDPAYNCGLLKADSSQRDLTVGGCYVLEYPNTIFIYYGDNTDYKDRLFVLLHEYGHYQQSQEGLFESTQWQREETESDADCRAAYLGADGTIAPCSIPGWTPTYLKEKYGLS